MPARWKRLDNVPQQTGQMQAVRAGKHVTVFIRSSSAPHAGSKPVKEGFTACAVLTRGVASRSTRTATMKKCMLEKKLWKGVYTRKSKSKYAPLKGKTYVVGEATPAKPAEGT